MNDLSKYLLLDEKRNAMDYLIQSLVFLTQVEQNRFYLKWFVVAFHGAIYSFMLLVLQSLKNEQIYKKLPSHYQKSSKTKKEKEFDPFDGRLIDFLTAYNYLKNSQNTGGQPFIPSNNQDKCMEELNDKFRNQLIHFRPMVLAYEPWYPAEVCIPLLDVLRFCVQFEPIHLTQDQRDTGLADIDALNRLLTKHTKEYSKSR